MYIPISNIVEVGYANEGRFANTKLNDPLLVSPSINLQSVPPYSGFFHKDNKGNFWTGKEHKDNSTILLEYKNKISADDSWSAYTNLKPKIFPPVVITPDFILPTENDYDNGFFSRFVVKPVISSQVNDFFEVNKEKFQRIIQNSDLLILYKPVTLAWKLTGPIYDYYENNIRLASGIIDTNKRSIQEAEKILPNVSLYFTDLKQFSGK